MPTPNNRSMPRKSTENESKAMWKWETKKLQQSYLESSPQEKWCLTTSSTLYLPLSGSLQGCSSSLASWFLSFFLFLSLKLSCEKLSLKTSTFLSFFSYSQLIFFCPSNPNTNLQLSQIFFSPRTSTFFSFCSYSQPSPHSLVFHLSHILLPKLSTTLPLVSQTTSYAPLCNRLQLSPPPSNRFRIFHNTCHW